MPTYITVEDEPDIVRIRVTLRSREKFRIYQDDGTLFIKILQKAPKNITSTTEEAFGVLFIVKDTYEFSLSNIEETHELKINHDQISTTADCAKGLLELQLPYVREEGVDIAIKNTNQYRGEL